MKVFNFPQYSVEWWHTRRGIPTASEFGSIMTAKTMKYAAGAETYIHRLIGDAYDLDYPHFQMESLPMQRGSRQEEESRNWYALVTGNDVRQVGFCLSDDGRFGCSPDGLIGDDGGLELKNPLPHTHVAYLLDGRLPDEYRAQVHGQLIVTGRAWWDFLSYCPGLPPLLVRVTPDEYTQKLREALEVFWSRLVEARAMIESMKELV